MISMLKNHPMCMCCQRPFALGSGESLYATDVVIDYATGRIMGYGEAAYCDRCKRRACHCMAERHYADLLSQAMDADWIDELPQEDFSQSLLTWKPLRKNHRLGQLRVELSGRDLGVMTLSEAGEKYLTATIRVERQDLTCLRHPISCDLKGELCQPEVMV